MIVRQMTEDDLDQVCIIEEDTFSQAWSRDDFSKSCIDINNSYLVVENNGEIVGYCGYWGVVGEGYIYNVAVKREFRGKQIGYHMLNQLIRQATQRGITSLTLEVRLSNRSAISLYERLGFVSSGIRRDFYTKPNEDAVIMWLKLIQ